MVHMKRILLFLLYVSSLATCSRNTNAEKRFSQKPKAAVSSSESVLKAGDFIISKSLDIMSSVSDDKQHSVRIGKLDTLKNEVHQGMTITHAQLTVILNKLAQATYETAIAKSELEIVNCFDFLDTYVKQPRDQHSIDNLKSCTSIIKYVKQIGKIMGGEIVGTASESLFDMIIRQHGHCNGTVIKELRSHLKELLFQGCSVAVAAEALIYGKSSSQYQRDCTTAFNETDIYAEKLYEKCSNEDCDIILKNMKFALQEVNTISEARTVLSNQFPWYYFTIIETVKCREDCFQDNFKSTTPKPFPFNLHTFPGKDKMFSVLYRDKRYSKNKIGYAVGFALPRSCMIDYSNDLDILTFYGQGVSRDISFYMYENPSVSTFAKICKSRSTKCESSKVGSLKIGFYTVAIFVLIVTVF